MTDVFESHTLFGFTDYIGGDRGVLDLLALSENVPMCRT
jgi:hypothetical protein